MSETNEMVTIEATIRQEKGKGYCHKLRKSGKIPGNVIVKGSASQAIGLDPKWLSKAWKNGKQFQMKLNGQVRLVKIHELQIDPTKRSALHVDLMYA